MNNLDRAEGLLRGLAALGVRSLAVAPGGRNAPLVAAIEASRGFEVQRFFEERSAAFFALGRARALDAPAAVVTTSGTAAAECLPAAIEAYYTGQPLIIVTADRPARLRGTGAPQTIEQPELFGDYAPTVMLEAGRPDARLVGMRRPLHLNVPFEDPLLDRPARAADYTPDPPAPQRGFEGRREDLDDFLAAATQPVVLVGALAARDTAAVRDFLLRLGAPVLAEAESGLREDAVLDALLVRGGDRGLKALEFDAVLRLGGVPAVRLWRDLDRDDAPPTFSVAANPFAGIGRGGLVHGCIGEVLAATEVRPVTAELEADRHRTTTVERLVAAEPTSEPALVRALSERLPADARVYLGNSLPIREWDQFAGRAPNRRRVFASRGANGIDGQLSTFLGLADPRVENWALVGDLTALYDLSAPWVLPQLRDRRLRIVVVNNGGGRIFGRLFDDPVFENRHAIGFEAWARMWNLAYERWETIPEQLPDHDHVVIELCPATDASARFWRAFDAPDTAP